MPLDFHKMAMPAAKAALAAREQGKFWEFHDRLFAQRKLSQGGYMTKSPWTSTLISRALRQDMASPKIQAAIIKDLHGCSESRRYRNSNGFY